MYHGLFRALQEFIDPRKLRVTTRFYWNDMENTDHCASTNGADQVICALFGPDWQDVLITQDGQVKQRCERCKQCERIKPTE